MVGFVFHAVEGLIVELPKAERVLTAGQLRVRLPVAGRGLGAVGRSMVEPPIVEIAVTTGELPMI